jgi:hypothetical protein
VRYFDAEEMKANRWKRFVRGVIEKVEKDRVEAEREKRREAASKRAETRRKNSRERARAKYRERWAKNR